MSYDIRFGVKVAGASPDCYAVIGQPEYDSPTYNLRDVFVKAMDWEYQQGEWYPITEVIPKAQAVKLSDSEDTCDPVNSPSHYIGKIECIDYLRDKLTQEEFTGFCMGNVLKYSSRWRKKDGLQDLKKAKVYLDWAIENEEKKNGNTEC